MYKLLKRSFILFFSMLFIFLLYNASTASSLPGARHTTIGTDVFLGGNYIEVGVSKSGTLGTATNAPGDFHVYGTRGLGMLIDGDGFNVGNPPTTGDFFIPGTPWEGYGIGYKNSLDQVTALVIGDRVNKKDITNISTTNTSSGDTLSATTTGTTNDGKLQITQVLSFGVDDKYFTIKVTIKNVSTGTVKDVRYLRSVDPDQDVDYNDTYDTYMAVTKNPPNDSLSYVYGKGEITGEPFIYFSADPRSRASITPFSTVMSGFNPYSTTYFQQDGSLLLTDETLKDEGMNLTFKLGDLSPAQSTTFYVNSSLDPDLSHVLSQTYPKVTSSHNTIRAGKSTLVTITATKLDGTTDTTFTGNHNVTISGFGSAPNDSIGQFNGTALNGTEITLPLSFSNGVAIAPLSLTRSGESGITFTINDLDIPQGTLNLTVTPDFVASLAISRGPKAPLSNGDTLTSQPVVLLKDTYGNVCTNNNSSKVTVSKGDDGSWALGGSLSKTAVNGIVTFSNLTATSEKSLSTATLQFSASGLTTIESSRFSIPSPPTNPRVTPSKSAFKAGEVITLTFTARLQDDSTNTSFNGVKNVTVTGYTASPKGSYGTFNGNNLSATSTTQALTFTNGVATASFSLHDATLQTLDFSVAGLSDPATNKLTLTLVPNTAKTLSFTSTVLPPSKKGNFFLRQPVLLLKDAYNNDCTNDSKTVVTVSKADKGNWTLTGTTSRAASKGIIRFSDLKPTYSSTLSNAQLQFSGTGLTTLKSEDIKLP